jgi:hypothetical protein
MPTRYTAQLVEPQPPMKEILDRMNEGLIPNARLILASLAYYSERDLPIPDQDVSLTPEERRELEPIAAVLANAAVVNLEMKAGVLISTLQKVAKNPALFFEGHLPAEVQWELSRDYQRENEKPGTFALDVWDYEEAISAYQHQKPTEATIKKAAEGAIDRLGERKRGRPPNPATSIIAFGLSKIFRSTGPIVRRHYPAMRGQKLVFIEGGPFYDFLDLVLPTLNCYLDKHGRAEVTTASVVRLVAEQFSPYPISPTKKYFQNQCPKFLGAATARRSPRVARNLQPRKEH